MTHAIVVRTPRIEGNLRFLRLGLVQLNLLGAYSIHYVSRKAR